MADQVTTYFVVCSAEGPENGIWECNLLAGTRFKLQSMDDFHFRKDVVLPTAGVPAKVWANGDGQLSMGAWGHPLV